MMKQSDVFECINNRVRKEVQGIYKAYSVVNGEKHMNPLDLLKAHLQNALNDGSRNADFREALGDGLYACSLGEAALDVLVFNWGAGIEDSGELSDADIHYQQGVQFVEQQWHQITGMF